VAYKPSNLKGRFCMIHNRCGTVVRKPLFNFIRDKYRLFDEVKNYIETLKEKSDVFV
jgi:hypothetical protein